jgi:hypothetical protein
MEAPSAAPRHWLQRTGDRRQPYRGGAGERDKKRTTATSKSPTVLSAEERAAMKELVQERKAQARGEDGESAVLGKIAEMPEPDRAMAERSTRS